MTLIATAISRFGIIHASDSNLTSRSTHSTIAGKKVCRLGFDEAALAVASSYSVDGQAMDLWMQSSIDDYSSTAKPPTLKGFALYLGARLTAEITDEEREGGTLIHLAGYVDDERGTRPEFYFVRNIEGVDEPTGGYVGRRETFDVTEDFWARDFARADVQAALSSGGSQLYFNGYPDGRIAYLGLVTRLQAFFREVWENPAWRFRPARSLDELASLVELEIRLICTMFLSSDYPAAYIGGDVQLETFPAPPNAFPL